MEEDLRSQGRIWLTWETQTRNRSLSSQMGATLFEKDTKLVSLLRYPYLMSWTIWVLLTSKTKVVFVQNPSLILSFLTILVGKIIQKKHVIVDAHNIALEPVRGYCKVLEAIRIFIIKYATYTIISNNELVSAITKYGGKPLVLADPLPNYKNTSDNNELNGKYKILYICSWAQDEPYCEVLKAASLLDKAIEVYVTGNSHGRFSDCLSELPDNIVLTGFIDEQEYENMLHSVDVIVDLTTRESCLLCGAYEAVSAEKPMVLSDTRALKEYFYKGAVYTDNTSIDIAEKINLILKERKYSEEVIGLKNEINVAWQIQKEKINRLIDALC